MRIDAYLLRITLLRKELTQSDLARHTGLSYSTIRSICGGRRCSLQTAEKIAKALDVDLNSISEAKR